MEDTSIWLRLLEYSPIVAILLLVMFFMYKFFTNQLSVKDGIIANKDEKLDEAAQRVQKSIEALKDVAKLFKDRADDSHEMNKDLANKLERLSQQINDLKK